MTLTELIEKIGLENITVTTVLENLMEVKKESKRTSASVTLAIPKSIGDSLLEGVINPSETRLTGLVLWFPLSKAKEVYDESKTKKISESSSNTIRKTNNKAKNKKLSVGG